ncbi:MAG: hypothetical protein Q4E62_05545 [Sutterellaceae bacterium]|nr:hypothetical protein [Sutterellaceae bacterium]
MWRLIFPILAYVLFAAHLMFHGFGLFVAAAGLLPAFFVGFRHKAIVYVHTALLILIGLEWLRAMWALVEIRLAHGMDWKLAAAILTGCALWSFVSAWIVYRRKD